MSIEQQDSPIFSIQKIYIKDISFENPNAPEIFTSAASQPKIEMNLGVTNRQLDEENWEVALKISVLARESESERVLFEIEVEQAGIFYIKNIPVEHIAPVLAVECPAIIFPYTRQIVSQLTVDGGFMPLLLEPFSFGAAYENSLKQQQAQQPLN
ncbi:protein-export chaperone SecB [Mariprofundus erugo]|uniref:Protein-export chaperone SecB n=1 Tax=Mariprofundus erugo TaxID=2528639 RepID=A0A5R9GWE7_9PROT|nr:protein-export chaperone SecB [Mariprofundus erugo]TLS69059.1 protein-export chaperone SecB [Mariprofundus erugo]TLS76022.1 protein-export chaperone SecB [Mariprofundus erugo]